MIKKLTIKNFQSHKLSKLEFVDGVNVIVGPSDSGKTSILRALDWALNNRPQGDAFRSDWGGRTKVIVAFSDYVVKRWKMKTENAYLLEWKQQAAIGVMPFKAFGVNVPKEISEAVNMTAINWQRQHDTHFLLSDNPPSVARQLNSIVHLDKIDSAFSNITKKIRANSQEQKNTTSTLEALKSELQTFDYLNGMEEDLCEIELLEQKLRKEENRVGALTSLLARITRQRKKLKQESVVLVLEEELDELVVYMKATKRISKRHEALERLLASIEETQDDLKENKRKAKSYKEAFDDQMPDVCPLCEQEIK